MKQFVHKFSNFINEQNSEIIFPSHEELEELYWFKKLSEFVTEIGGTMKCSTLRRAYLNGTRSINIDTPIYSDATYIIYPKKGTIVYGPGSINRDLPFNSIQDWNIAIFEIYSRFTSNLLRVSRPSFKKALINKDASFFFKIQPDVINLPLTAILKILELIASKEEIADYLLFNSIGLF